MTGLPKFGLLGSARMEKTSRKGAPIFDEMPHRESSQVRQESIESIFLLM